MTRATPSLRFTASRPEIHRRAASLFFSASLLLVAFQGFFVGVFRFLAVAVMRFVVDDEDVLHAHQVGHHALEHLAFGFERLGFFAAAALEQLPSALGQIDALAHLEGVIVGDDDLGAFHVVEHVARHQFAVFVVTVGVVGLQDAQTVLDGQAGGADQKTAREVLAGGAAHRIDGLPGNDHGHDRGLAGAGGKLQRQAHQLGIGILVGRREVIEDALALLGLGRNLGQPDRRLRGLHLTEERADVVELVMTPVLQQAGGLRRDLPLIGIGQGNARNPHAHALH
jgi:hypothetical protein